MDTPASLDAGRIRRISVYAREIVRRRYGATVTVTCVSIVAGNYPELYYRSDANLRCRDSGSTIFPPLSLSPTPTQRISNRVALFAATRDGRQYIRATCGAGNAVR